MGKLDNVQRVIALDAIIVSLESKRRRAVETENETVIGRICGELNNVRHEREEILHSLSDMEDRRYEVECEERHE